MTETNFFYKDMERFLQTKEEIEYWAAKFSESINEYQSAFINHYPSVDALEKDMEENREALVEWAIEYNKAKSKVANG